MAPRLVRCALVVGLVSFFIAAMPARAQESAAARGQGVERAVVGTLRQVNSSANRILLRMRDGIEHELTVTKSTKFDGARCPATLFDLPQLTGDNVIVVFTDDRDEKTASIIKCFDPEALKMVEGTLARIDPLTRRVVIRTLYGEDAVFRLAESTTFDSGATLIPRAAFATYRGEQVIAYYTSVGEDRIISLLRLNREIPNCRLERDAGGTAEWPT